MIRRLYLRLLLTIPVFAMTPNAQAEPHLIPPAPVVALKPPEQKPGEHRYLKFYWDVVRTHGRRAPGRNLVTRGFRTRHGHVREPSQHELGRSIRTFKRWLAPPAAPIAATDRVPTGQSPAYAGGRWAIPSYIVMCESGGNYNAVNGSSGARGAYQLMPSTYYGHGGDGSWSPADQDRVAARVWNGGAGRGQWVC